MGNDTILTDSATGLPYHTSATSPPRRGTRWYMCDICGLDFPAGKIEFYQGKAFGVPCGCHKDIPDLILKEGLEAEYNREGTLNDME